MSSTAVNAMIRNIVFDIMGVLVTGNYHDAIAEKLHLTPKEVISLLRIMSSDLWHRCDLGEFYGINEVIDRFETTPRVREALLGSYAVFNRENGQMSGLMKELGKDCKVYLLSNLSHKMKDDMSSYSFFDNCEGHIFSYEEKLCKPDPEIFSRLIQRYGLKPEETIFIDDSPANIRTARKLGFLAIRHICFPLTARRVRKIVGKQDNTVKKGNNSQHS